MTEPALVLAAALVAVAFLLLLTARARRMGDPATAFAEIGSHDPGRDSAAGDQSPSTLDPMPQRAPTTEEIASAMVLMAVAMQSGCGVIEAVEHAAALAPGPAGAELLVVAAALRWGVADQQAWAVVDPAWSRAAVALRVAAISGVAPSSLLLAGAEDLRASRLASLDVAAARLGVRLVLPLGLTFLPAFVLTTVVPVVVALARQLLQP